MKSSKVFSKQNDSSIKIKEIEDNFLFKYACIIFAIRLFVENPYIYIYIYIVRILFISIWIILWINHQKKFSYICTTMFMNIKSSQLCCFYKKFSYLNSSRVTLFIKEIQRRIRNEESWIQRYRHAIDMFIWIINQDISYLSNLVMFGETIVIKDVKH